MSIFPLTPISHVVGGREDGPLVGIFAQRGKNRPNRLGVSRCELLKVDGLDLHVRGLDAVAGTPVLDLKPWLAEFGARGEVRQAAWSTELMEEYYRWAGPRISGCRSSRVRRRSAAAGFPGRRREGQGGGR